MLDLPVYLHHLCNQGSLIICSAPRGSLCRVSSVLLGGLFCAGRPVSSGACFGSLCFRTSSALAASSLQRILAALALVPSWLYRYQC